MSLTLSPSAIAVLALRRVRRVAPFETGGEGPHLTIALQHLDLVMAELAGTERLWWLTKIDQELAIEAGQQEYDLSGIQSPDPQDIIRAVWVDATQRREPICLYRQEQWDEIDDRLYRQSATPEGAYVERTPASKLWVYPIPTEDGALHMTQQVIASDITNTSSNPSELPSAWQRYFVLALAAEIGSGPIERLSEQEINRLTQQAANAKNILLARNRKENVRRPRFVQPWDPTR